jgi:hypothetical protein
MQDAKQLHARLATVAGTGTRGQHHHRQVE